MPRKWHYVMGVDPSLTGTAVALVDYEKGNLVDVCTIATKKGEYRKMERIAYVRDKVLIAFYRYGGLAKVAPVFIEGYGFGCRGQAVFDLAGLGDTIRMGLAEFVCTPYYEISPTLLKKFITCKGNANKNIVLEQVFRKYGLGSETLRDDNQVDAFSLAKFGQEFLNWKYQGIEVRKNSKECFSKVGEPETYSMSKVVCGHEKHS